MVGTQAGSARTRIPSTCGSRARTSHITRPPRQRSQSQGGPLRIPNLGIRSRAAQLSRATEPRGAGVSSRSRVLKATQAAIKNKDLQDGQSLIERSATDTKSASGTSVTQNASRSTRATGRPTPAARRKAASRPTRPKPYHHASTRVIVNAPWMSNAQQSLLDFELWRRPLHVSTGKGRCP